MATEKSKIQFQWALHWCATEGGTYAELCKLRLATIPGSERGVVNVTELHDLWKKILGGTFKIGDCRFEALITEANYALVWAKYLINPGENLLWWKIIWPLETSPVQTTAAAFKFQGLIKSMDSSELRAEGTDAVVIPFVIEGSGPLVVLASAV